MTNIWDADLLNPIFCDYYQGMINYEKVNLCNYCGALLGDLFQHAFWHWNLEIHIAKENND